MFGRKPRRPADRSITLPIGYSVTVTLNGHPFTSGPLTYSAAMRYATHLARYGQPSTVRPVSGV